MDSYSVSNWMVRWAGIGELCKIYGEIIGDQSHELLRMLETGAVSKWIVGRRVVRAPDSPPEYAKLTNFAVPHHIIENICGNLTAWEILNFAATNRNIRAAVLWSLANWYLVNISNNDGRMFLQPRVSTGNKLEIKFAGADESRVATMSAKLCDAELVEYKIAEDDMGDKLCDFMLTNPKINPSANSIIRNIIAGDYSLNFKLGEIKGTISGAIAKFTLVNKKAHKMEYKFCDSCYRMSNLVIPTRLLQKVPVKSGPTIMATLLWSDCPECDGEHNTVYYKWANIAPNYTKADFKQLLENLPYTTSLAKITLAHIDADKYFCFNIHERVF